MIIEVFKHVIDVPSSAMAERYTVINCIIRGHNTYKIEFGKVPPHKPSP